MYVIALRMQQRYVCLNSNTYHSSISQHFVRNTLNIPETVTTIINFEIHSCFWTSIWKPNPFANAWQRWTRGNRHAVSCQRREWEWLKPPYTSTFIRTPPQPPYASQLPREGSRGDQWGSRASTAFEHSTQNRTQTCPSTFIVRSELLEGSLSTLVPSNLLRT